MDPNSSLAQGGLEVLGSLMDRIKKLTGMKTDEEVIEFIQKAALEIMDKEPELSRRYVHSMLLFKSVSDMFLNMYSKYVIALAGYIFLLKASPFTVGVQ